MSDGDSKVTPGEFLSQLKGADSATAIDTDLPDSMDDLDLDFSHLDEIGDDLSDQSSTDSEFSLTAEMEAAEQPERDSAREPTPTLTRTPDAVKGNAQLNDLFDRVHNLLGPSQASAQQVFCPEEPTSLEETCLTFEEVERLILKYLLSKGSAFGRAICSQIRLPYNIVDPILKQLKLDQMVSLNGAGQMGDYNFAITDFGRERARRYSEECTYFGAAPVALKDYLAAMAAQSVAKQHATESNLREAFSDLIINEKMLDRLGPAINSGRGMFLFGEPGNGKTSIAERVTKAFGSSIWIPRALGIDGDIIRLFDPGVHEELHENDGDGLFDLSGVDQRWVKIVRPTVIAGGELTMSELEVVQNLQTKICEAPLQLKSNCGTLVIDDFGRQTMPVDVLLNRWIVPLEKRYDFLNLPSGKKIQVPFDQLIIFSTNLEPRDLVDGAFLRRIPYKIEVGDPSEAEFRQLIDIMAPMSGFESDPESIEYLIETHYRAANRPFRACQPRDLLAQVKNYCVYKEIPKKMSPEAFDFAAEIYFSVM
jgi:hypothetical protein